MDSPSGGGRTRRPPPPFRVVEVLQTRLVTPRMVRLTLGGPALAGFEVGGPAASIRLLVPPAGGASGELRLPEWSGNEFLLPDGTRPVLRTLTPLFPADDHAGTATGPRLAVEVVVHPGGAASQWATAARPGDVVAFSGPGRGYDVDVAAPSYLLGGDETALPAIGQLLEVLGGRTPVAVHVEVAHLDARRDLPAVGDPASVHWHPRALASLPGEALVSAVRAAPIERGTRLWIAGEARAVQQIRRHLFGELGLPRAEATVRGYWKYGHAGDDANE